MRKTIVATISMEEEERRTLQHDWSKNIVTGTAITSVDVRAYNLINEVDSTFTFVVVSATPTGNITTFTIRKPTGTDLIPVRLTLTMIRDDFDSFVDHYLMPTNGQTVYELIDGALRLLGVRNIGADLSQQEQEIGLHALNTMLLSWSSERMLVQGTQVDTFPTVTGKGSYTLGPAGDKDTIRPEKILSAFVRGGSMDYKLAPLGAEAFDAIALKSTTKIPELFFFDDGYPLPAINLYPIPDTVYQVSVRSIKQVVSYPTVAMAHGLEGDYEHAVKYNLAIHMAPQYGMQVAPEVVGIAQQSASRLINERYGKLDATLDVGMMVV